MTKVEILELAKVLSEIGKEITLEPEEAQAYLPQIDNLRDFYLPRVPENFYYDPKVFRRLLGIR